MAGVLTGAAAEEAAALARATDPEQDLEASLALGLFHWSRFQALPEDAKEAEFDAAVRFLLPVYRLAPSAVPAPLRDFFAHSTAKTEEAERVDLMVGRATALSRAYQNSGRLPQLVEAVGLFRDALPMIPEDHPAHLACLSNLTVTLLALFERTGDIALVAETTDTARRAVRATPEGHPGLAGNLNSLSLALRASSVRTGSTALLAEAVEVGRRSVQASPEGHPDHARHLSNLNATLQPLFERTGDTALLAEGADAARRAVQATPEDHPDRPGLLNNLSATLQTLFGRTGDGALLAEAVEAGRQAVEATAQDSSDRARHLNNFGAALQALFGRTGNTGPLAMAVDVQRQAIEATPDDHPERAGHLNNLGAALQTLFGRTGDTAQLAEAVDVGRQAVQATPQDHPDRAPRLCNLGNALRTLFERTGDPQASAEAVQVYRTASRITAATVLVRLEAHRELAALLTDVGERLAAAESAVALLPQVNLRTLARDDREHRIGRIGSLAEVAAAAALAAGDPQRAVELLEATRGMLVADVIDARGNDVARLREHAPALAREFEDLRDRREALDRSSGRTSSAAGAAAGRPDRTRGEDLAQARQRAQSEWDSLVGRIRTVDGFAGFLAAPDITELTAQAADGPIVFLTTASARSDALVVTGDAANPVRVVNLDRLTRQDASDRAEQLLQARRIATSLDQSSAARKAAQQDILDVLAWLWDVVADPVLTALGRTGLPPQDADWTRLWWCPVGVTGYLPVHAAGHHRDLGDADAAVKAAPRTVLDRVVSSYTLTVRALAYARSHRPAVTEATLIVAVPDAPGTTPLTGVEAESEAVAALIPAASRPGHPVRAEVLAALPTHPVAHFSCHGLADWTDPAASRLILHDHETDPLTVADISALRLTGSLAYLSACDTSSTNPRLADEAVHLTGAFHLAGYRNAIGTLWPVDDGSATQIATDFYTRLTSDGSTPPDTAGSARALHHAVRALRGDYPATPTFWAAHTHTGI
ncbi:hypothetical protein GCM10009839_01170 [Catenulispora yoronensis]|uniref:CHAT domain-containing protein n=1 Tax=Catenulispora yoronensis TaxID=450799 RepID=A0ABP5EXN1_9ACTN